MKHLLTKSSKDSNDGGILIIGRRSFVCPNFASRSVEHWHLSHSFLPSSSTDLARQ